MERGHTLIIDGVNRKTGFEHEAQRREVAAVGGVDQDLLLFGTERRRKIRLFAQGASNCRFVGRRARDQKPHAQRAARHQPIEDLPVIALQRHFMRREIAAELSQGKSTVASRVETGLVLLNRCFQGGAHGA